MKTDVGWKYIIDELLPQFIEFFMPDLYDFVDFEKGLISLEQEFISLFPESATENRRADKLVGVYLKNGEEKWVLLHIEIQSYKDANFDKRMYQYYARIFDKYNREIEAIAVFTYKSSLYKFDKYESKFLKTELIYKFRTYDIAKQNQKKLAKSKNPFSFVVQTLIKAFEHKDTDESNFNFKKELVNLLFKSGFTEDEINGVFVFLNFIFEIQDEIIRRKFYTEVIEMSVKEKVRIELTDFEQTALEIQAEKLFEKEVPKIKKSRDMEITKKLKAKNMPLEEISEITGLSIEEIEKL